MKKAQPEADAIDLLKGIKRNLERGRDYDDFILDTNIQKKFSKFSDPLTFAALHLCRREALSPLNLWGWC